MTGNLKLLSNFVEQFLGTMKFGNDQIEPTHGYGDMVQGNVTIKRVYYVKGLNHNLFSVGEFCDVDLEVSPSALLLKQSNMKASALYRRYCNYIISFHGIMPNQMQYIA
ncbi:hypothetical protein Tco_1358668 [Tanacetum coccineum]